MTGVQGAGAESLEAIEGDAWGDAPSEATRLMATVYELRRKPLGALSPEDLRVLIAQGVGMDVLMPLALASLERDPLVEGDFYPGDLLGAVLRVGPRYWAAHPAERSRMLAVVDAVDAADIGDHLRSLIQAARRQP